MVLILLILIAAGLLWRRNQVAMQNAKNSNTNKNAAADKGLDQNSDSSALADPNSDQASQDFEAQCANGEWMKIADVQGDAISLTGKLRKVYSGDDISQDLKVFPFYVEGKENVALSGSDLSSLDNFEDRDVEVRGVRSSDGKSVAVSEVRCAGAETDKTVIDARTKLMNWLAADISSVAPGKAPYQKWTIDTVEFVDEKNVYVEYYDTVEDDENATIPDNVDTTRRMLIETGAKSDGNYDTKILAYWEMGESDYVLKTGSDKFENVTDTTMYQYDSEQKSWTRI